MKYLLLIVIFLGSCKDDLAIPKQVNQPIILNTTNAIGDTIAIKKTEINSAVWAKIVLSQQRMYLYENGVIVDTYKVTTGNRKHKTPLMNRRPSGPMHLKYSSKKYPGGNYMDLGNMPYVVFIKGGYAIHGTTPDNFSLLGKTASHGCIRLHPTNAKIFYDMVQKYSLNETWITIQN